MNKKHTIVATVFLSGVLVTFGIFELVGPSAALAGAVDVQNEQSQAANAKLLQRMNQLESRLTAIEQRGPTTSSSTGSPGMTVPTTLSNTVLALQSAVASLESRVNQLVAEVATLQQGQQAQQAALQKLQTQFASLPKPVYSYCKDSHTLASSKGQVWACDPYICQGTACLKQCGMVSDCAMPNVCNQNGACIAPPNN